MTTQEKKSFEEKLEVECDRRFNISAINEMYFKEGAHWAREETLSEVFNILGAARLFEIADMLHYQLRSKEFESVHPEFTKGAENERT